MKLKDSNTDTLDLTQDGDEGQGEAAGQIPKQVDSEFWQSIRQLARYGVPGYDKKGHWAEMRVRVRPLQVDMISALREKMPEGWFKNAASLYRSVIAVGCKVMLNLLEMERTEWDEILDSLNQIAKQERLQKFREEMAGLRSDIANGTLPAQEKVKVIDLMTKLEKRIGTL